MEFCKRSKIASAIRIADRQVCLFIIPCHSWSCERCGPIKRTNLIHRIITARPKTFLTLTCLPLDGEDPRDTYDRTRRHLSLLFRHFRRTNRAGEYVRVIEQTKKGYPHYHCLVRTEHYWPQSEISSIWYALTGAYVVDVRTVKSEHAIEYVSKYMTKDTIDFTNQRISSSRNFFKKKPPKSPPKFDSFKLYREHPADVIEDFKEWSRAEKINWQTCYEIHERTAGDEWPEELEPYLFS